MRVRTLFGLWLPLAVSFELMMLEGPTVQGAIGRLPHPQLHLAAMGLALSLSLLVESPVIMLLATAIALVRDGATFRALRRFVVLLAVCCTALTALVAFTPLFDIVTSGWMGQPAPIVQAARPAMRIMLLWTAAIAWRRFYQGVLVKYDQTRKVSWGTAFRLTAAVTTGALLTPGHRLPGAQVGACALMAGVVVEAIATTLFALPLVRGRIADHIDESLPPLTPSRIWSFHAPLAATTLLTLLAQPMTSAALARLPGSRETLAAWPVAFLLLLILRGWGLALQEITVAHARDAAARPALKRFAVLVGGATSLGTAVIVATPLVTAYFHHVLQLPPALHSVTRLGVAVGLLMPLITSLGSWARGLLVAGGATDVVYRGMGINLATHGGMLAAGVWLRLPGMWVAAGAFSTAALVEYFYIYRKAALLEWPRPLSAL
jgi:progressive ankylosis protein